MDDSGWIELIMKEQDEEIIRKILAMALMLANKKTNAPQ